MILENTLKVTISQEKVKIWFQVITVILLSHLFLCTSLQYFLLFSTEKIVVFHFISFHSDAFLLTMNFAFHEGYIENWETL